jgi:KaiC/GvpD/RAD55 family RecA-like ATPase
VGEEELEAVGFGGGLADGVISLYYEGEGLTRDRALEIRKMRGTVHSNQLHFFDITDKGIVVKKLPEELGKSSEGHEPKGA